MQLLLVDESETLGMRIGDMLRDVLPDASLGIWNPRDRGPLPADLRTLGVDAVMLTHRKAGDSDGLRLLRAMRGKEGAPATIVLLEGLTGPAASEAMASGAGSLLALPALSPSRVATAIRLALSDKSSSQVVDAPQAERQTSIAGFRLIRQIGEGGMASVFIAERGGGLAGKRDVVVIKLIDTRLVKDPVFIRRFERECKALASIAHDNVVRILDYSTTLPSPYLAMEYFAAGDLKARIRQGGITSRFAMQILAQIARALDAVHSAGLVHRDLKPQNVMFRDLERIALVDFGLAKPMDPGIQQAQLTQAGVILATPVYMCPEQCLGKPQDARSDLYSAGVVLYEMLTGSPPFFADNAAGLAYDHVHSPVPPLPARLAGYQGIVDRLLAKNPDARFQSARELLAHIAF